MARSGTPHITVVLHTTCTHVLLYVATQLLSSGSAWSSRRSRMLIAIGNLMRMLELGVPSLRRVSAQALTVQLDWAVTADGSRFITTGWPNTPKYSNS